MKLRPVRSDMDAWSVLRFMDDIVERASICRDYIHSQTKPPEINTALVSAIVQLLASLRESLAVLEELCSETEKVGTSFANDLKLWTSFRHDAAHFADRLFRESAPGLNEAAIIGGPRGTAYMVLGYVAGSDEVATGDDLSARMTLLHGILRAKELCAAAAKVVHDNYHKP